MKGKENSRELTKEEFVDRFEEIVQSSGKLSLEACLKLYSHASGGSREESHDKNIKNEQSIHEQVEDRHTVSSSP